MYGVERNKDGSLSEIINYVPDGGGFILNTDVILDTRASSYYISPIKTCRCI